MATKKITDEILKLDIVVNGNAAQKELYKLDETNRSISQTQKDLRAEKIKLLAAGKKESEQYKTISKQIKDNNKTIRENKTRMGELRKEIGITSLTSKQLTAHQKELRFAFANATPGTKAYKDYEKQLKEVNTQVNKLKQASNGTGGVVNNLKKHIGSTGTALIGLASVGSVIALGKQVYNTTQEVIELRHETKLLTDLFGKPLDNAVAKTKALADTFGTDYKENLLAANAITEAYQVDYIKALEVIEKGYLAGANISGDMLDQLEEYAPLMREVNLPLEDFVGLLTQAKKEGVFSDKGLDTIKEGMLRIREGVDGAKDGLEGLGINSDEVYKKLQTGSINYLDVMKLISQRLGEVGDQSPEVGAAIANIFGGAGEDASLRYLKALKDIDTNINNLIDSTDEITQLRQEEISVNEQLNQSWINLSSAGGFLNRVMVSAKGVLADMLTSVNDTYYAANRLKEVTGQGYWSGLFTKGYEDLANWAVEMRNIREEATKGDEPLKTLTTHLENINTQIAKEAELNAQSGKRSKVAQNQRIKESANRIKLLQDEAKQTAIAIDELNKVEEEKAKKRLETRHDLEKRATELKISFTEGMSNVELQNLINKENKRLNIVREASKKEADAKKLLYANALKTIDGFIEQQTNEQIAKSKKGLDKDLFNIQQKYAKQIELAKKNGIDTAELIRLQGEEETAAKLAQKQKEDEVLKAFEEQQRISKIELDAENRALDAATDEERTLILLQKTRDVANAQIEIEREKQLEILRLNGGTLQQIADLNATFDKQKEITNKNYNKAVQEQDKKTSQKKEQLLADEFGATATFFNGVGQMLGENTKAGKVAAAAQATVNTWQGVTQIWKNETTLPEPFGTIQKIGATGIALASGLNAVRAINSTNDKVPGYETGKYNFTRTDGKVFNAGVSNSTATQMVTEPTYFSNGGYLAGENGAEMIIDNPTLRQLPQETIDNIYITHRRVRGFETGNINTTANPSPSANENTTQKLESIMQNQTMFLQLLYNKLDEGINAYPVFGYSQVKDMDKIRAEIEASTQKGKLS
ncbi:hypothetical protein AXE80_10895 [Wenyingzhuangia fucanilytica]|uniref:Phage tail tape measure protein domain-containing protein n=1 Tax=Wenyingzhuangia fucanilytica TaxID=1790137 RepID=A0A1B1Y7J2_9FLAO|nr:phage tail tape measure protein [Wenyingzhuangia fucanilytica]ANW96751.1 hypothetical protein AXE80_10895 [Wenyingzhuangia fucanilytica]